MVECTTYKTPWPIRNVWKKLYAEYGFSPFQSWISNWWYFLTYHLKGSRLSYQPRFLLFTDKVNSCILPIAVDSKHKRVIDFSQGGPIDYYDVISSTRDVDFISKCVDLLKTMYGGYEILFRNVNHDSLLAKALPETAISATGTCVKIVFASAQYEDYYQSLSKHQRQNLRTAYNKLQREEIAWHVEKYDLDRKMPRSVSRECRRMYDERCRMRRERAKGTIGNGWKQKINEWKNGKIDLIDILASRWNRTSSFVMYMNETPVAYIIGMYNKQRDTFYVPRLSCNNEYLRYDAGIVMLNEAIKILLGEGVKIVDLTRGDEPYKYAMGGEAHTNYAYKL